MPLKFLHYILVPIQQLLFSVCCIFYYFFVNSGQKFIALLLHSFLIYFTAGNHILFFSKGLFAISYGQWRHCFFYKIKKEPYALFLFQTGLKPIFYIFFINSSRSYKMNPFVILTKYFSSIIKLFIKYIHQDLFYCFDLKACI